MKKISLLTVISLGMFALIGCGNTAEKANTGAPKEVSADKTFKVNEVVEKVRAEKDTWKGKEVIVSGLVSQISGHNVTLWNKKWDKEYVICVLPAPIQESPGETAEVRGKISDLTTQGENTVVKLEPCELKKSEAPKNANTEPAKNVFKHVEISPDAVKVNEFVDKVAANLNAWKGKEVTATGYVSMTSPRGNEAGYILQLRNDEKGGSDAKVIGCSVQKGGVPEGIVMKAVEVKGTVSEMRTGDTFKAVSLDPCTLKQ